MLLFLPWLFLSALWTRGECKGPGVRGRGFAPGSSGEGARRSGRTRLLASLQTPPRAPEVPGPEGQGSRVPTVLASWLGSGCASPRSREGWAPGAHSDRGEGNRARPVALQVLKFSAEGNAPKTSHWKWLCGWTPVAGGSSRSRTQTPSPLWATGDPQAARVEVAVPVQRCTKAKARPGGTSRLPPTPGLQGLL